MKNKTRMLATVGAMLLAAKASAITKTFTDSYSGLTALNPVATLTLNDFNPALGTLTGVTVTLTSIDTISAFVENISGYEPPFGPSGVNIAYSSVAASADVTVNSLTPLLSATSTGTVNYAPGTALPGYNGLIPTATAPVSASYSPGAAGFAAFEAPGTYQVEVTHGKITAGGSSIDPNSDLLSYGGSFSSAGTVAVTYNYIAVPDSGLTASLLGMGMVGCALCGRKMIKLA
jgi:hypothetical protein